MTVHGLMWVTSLYICVKMCALMGMRPEWPRNTGSQSESLICDFSRIVTEGFTILETVF